MEPGVRTLVLEASHPQPGFKADKISDFGDVESPWARLSFILIKFAAPLR